MIDRKKVINGLHEMSCRATWKDIDGIRDKFQPIINGAIGLLKEHEPKMVVVQDDGCPCCPTCGNELYPFPHHQKYCDECGQAVKWE